MDQQSTTISHLRGVEATLPCVPETRSDEALLPKCHSEREGGAVLSPRGACEDPAASGDVLPREGIELRTIAFQPA